MRQIVRQRLVGTLVLLALAVVFWPIIFVSPVTDQPIVLEPMPPRPKIDESPLPPPVSKRAVVENELPLPEVNEAAQLSADEATLLDGNDESTANDDLNLDSVPPALTLDPLENRTSAPVAVARDDSGFAKSWALQVATVSSVARADKLVKQLQAKGYEAFHQKLIRQEKPLWRVQIGPKLEQAKFKAIKAEVDKALNVDSRIVRYLQ